MKINYKILRSVIYLLFTLTILLCAYLILPINTSDLFAPVSSKSPDYESSKQLVQDIISQETKDTNPLCKTRFFDHGKKTAKVVILLHGLSNCPKQFEQLGVQLFEKGHNVFIPRIPHHGLKNRLTEDLNKITAQELIDFTARVVDISSELGTEKEIIGLSMGGVMTMWAAQNREDINHAIIIAPNLGHKSDPKWANGITRTALWLPPLLWWWDENFKDTIPGPQYAYPRYSTKGVGETFKLGYQIRNTSIKNPFKSEKITMITNEIDEAVSPELIQEQVKIWKKNKQAYLVEEFQFSAADNLGHDIIDPLQPYSKTEIVYPVLINMVKQ